MATENERQNFSNDPANWRARIRPFLVDDGSSRKATIASTREEMKRLESFSRELDVNDLIPMTKTQFKEHQRQNLESDYESDAASTEFLEDYRSNKQKNSNDA